MTNLLQHHEVQILVPSGREDISIACSWRLKLIDLHVLAVFGLPVGTIADYTHLHSVLGLGPDWLFP